MLIPLREPWESTKREKGIQKALGRYVHIVEGKLPAKYLIAKRVSAPFNESLSTTKLWRLHSAAMRRFRETQAKIDAQKLKLAQLKIKEKSLLDLKLEIATRIMASCCFCVRRCGVNRLMGEVGFCKAGLDWKIFGAHLHYGEESILVPSATIFQAACSMRCSYCQNAPESITPELGVKWSTERAADWIAYVSGEGARNINWVGGEPTPWTWHIIKTLTLCDVNLPQVWNSNSYYSQETAKLLDGIIDVYLLDFRYWSDGCAQRLSAAPKYREAAIRAHLSAAKAGEVLIRLLILPGHIDCDAKPIVEWVAKSLGNNVRLNLMSQYRPEWKAFNYPEISRRLYSDEYWSVVRRAQGLGLWNLEIQGM